MKNITTSDTQNVSITSSYILHYLLLLRNQMKIYHWQTKKFARHNAADLLVEELDKLTDKYIEAYSGIYQNIIIYPDTCTLGLDNISDKNIPNFLSAIRKILITETDKITNSELLNIRDEILNVIDKTIYLFRLD